MSEPLDQTQQSTEGEIEQTTYEKTLEFVQNLLEAGMSLHDTMAHAFTYAREVYGHEVQVRQERYLVYQAEAMTGGARVLLRIAKDLHSNDSYARAHAEAVVGLKGKMA